MTFELAAQAAAARRRNSSNSAHPSFQLQHEHGGKMIPSTPRDGKGEVCRKEQEPPLPGAAGVASLYTSNAQICFPLES